MSTSRLMKTEALCWLRFGKKYELVATEVGRWNADVLGASDTSVLEVEVKCTLADLKRDFENKADKIYLYSQGGAGSARRGVPNFMYYLVPLSLADKALVVLASDMPKAGLAVYLGDFGRPGDRVAIKKKAARLHSEKPDSNLERSLMLRMGSELCYRYLANHVAEKLGKAECDQEVVAKIDAAVRETLLAAQEVPDYEESDGHQETDDCTTG